MPSPGKLLAIGIVTPDRLPLAVMRQRLCGKGAFAVSLINASAIS
jgi:hypothetical protein